MESFNTRFEKLLKEKNLTKTDIGKKLDIPVATINYWKNGTLPRVDVAVRLAKILDTTVEYLITGECGNIPDLIKDKIKELNDLVNN